MRQYILNGSEATSVSSPRRKSKSGLRRLSLILLFLLAPLLGRGGTESASAAAHEYRLRFYHTHTGKRLDVVYRVRRPVRRRDDPYFRGRALDQ
jgi:hypothetical protein